MVLTPTAATKHGLSACKYMVAILVKRVKDGVWSVKFGSLGIRQCCVGFNSAEGKEAYDLYYLQSPLSMAAGASKPTHAFIHLPKYYTVNRQ